MPSDNQIPIASMLIEATDGGSLQKLATAVAAFANKPQKIKVGVDYSDFDPSKLPSLTARLGGNLQSEMKRQMKFTGADKKALVDSLGNPTQALGEYMSKAMAAMPAMMLSGMKEAMAPVGRAMAAEIFGSLQKESAKQAGMVAKNMALILKHGTNTQQAHAQTSSVASAAAISGAAPSVTEGNYKRIVGTLIEKEYKKAIANKMSQRAALEFAQDAGINLINQHKIPVENPIRFAKGAASPILQKINASELAARKSQEAAAAKAIWDRNKEADAKRKRELELAQIEEKHAALNPVTQPAFPIGSGGSNLGDIAKRAQAENSSREDYAKRQAARERQEAKEAKVRSARVQPAFPIGSGGSTLGDIAKAANADAVAAVEKAAQDKKEQDKKDAADAKVKNKQQTDRLRQLSPTVLKKRYAQETRNLSGQGALDAALNLDAVLLKEIEDAVSGSPRNQQSKTKKTLRQNLQESRRSYTDPRHSLIPESDLAGNAEYAEGIMGSRTGQRIGTRQVLDRAEAFRIQRTAERDRLDEAINANPNAPDIAQKKADRAYATVDLAKNEAATKKILALHKEDEQILARVNKGYASGIYGQLKQRLDADSLLTNQRKRESIANPKQSSLESAHNMNFAAMNAAYGFQDFFQVLAQPGMGVSRAFLAAANNIGPALGVLAGSAVGANVAVGALLAGMAGLQMVMGKDEEKLKGVKDAVDDLAKAYGRLSDAKVTVDRASRSSGGSTGSKGILGLQEQLLNQPQNADKLSYQSSQNQIKTESARVSGDAARGYWNGIYAESAGATKWPLFDTTRGFFGGMGRTNIKDFPTDRKESMFPDIQTFEQEGLKVGGLKNPKFNFIKDGMPDHSVDDPITQYIDRIKDLQKTGAARRKFDEFKDKANARKAKEKENGGYADDYIAAMDAHEVAKEHYKGLSESADKHPSEILSTYFKTKAKAARLGVPGQENELVKNAFLDRGQYIDSASKAEVEFEAVTKRNKPLMKPLNDEKTALINQASGFRKSGDQVGLMMAEDELGVVQKKLDIFNNEIEQAAKAVETYRKLVDKSGEAFDLLAKQVGGGKVTASLFLPGFNKDGSLSASKRRADVNTGVQEVKKRYDTFAPEDKRFMDSRSNNLQFGDQFAASMSKIEEIKTDLISFRGTNFSKNPGQRNANAASQSGLEMGKVFGMNLESVDMAMQRSTREAEALRKSLDDLAKSEPGAKESIETMKHLLEASVLKKDQQAVSNDPLMQAKNSVNKYFIELENLNKAIKEGGELAEGSDGKFKKQEGRILKLNEALTRLGFSESLNQQISDFDSMVEQVIETMRQTGSDPEKIKQVKAQADEKRADMIWNKPDQVQHRAAQGGFSTNLGMQDRFGSVLNFEGKIESLRDKHAKDSLQRDLSPVGQKRLDFNLQKDIQNEIGNFASSLGYVPDIEDRLREFDAALESENKALAGNKGTQAERDRLRDNGAFFRAKMIDSSPAEVSRKKNLGGRAELMDFGTAPGQASVRNIKDRFAGMANDLRIAKMERGADGNALDSANKKAIQTELQGLATSLFGFNLTLDDELKKFDAQLVFVTEQMAKHGATQGTINRTLELAAQKRREMAFNGVSEVVRRENMGGFDARFGADKTSANAKNFQAELEKENLKFNLDKQAPDIAGNPETVKNFEEAHLKKIKKMIADFADGLGYTAGVKDRLKTFDESVEKLMEILDKTNGITQEDKDRAKASTAQSRREIQRGLPDAQAARANLGGRVDNAIYGNNSGRMLNFEDRIKAMKADLAKNLDDNDLGEAGRASYMEDQKKAVQREIAGMVGSGNGKTQVIDSSSLWQRIQESLTSDPSMQIEQQQLDMLTMIHNDLQMGRTPSGAAGKVYQKMLGPEESLPEGFDSGGYAGFGKKPSSRDVIPAYLRYGEAVVPPEKQAEIAGALGINPFALFGTSGANGLKMNRGKSFSEWSKFGQARGFDDGGLVGGMRYSSMLNGDFRKWQKQQDAAKAYQNRQMGKQEHEEEFADTKSKYSVQSGRLGLSGFYRNQGVNPGHRQPVGRISGPGSSVPTAAEAWPNGFPVMKTTGPIPEDMLTGGSLQVGRLGQHAEFGYGSSRATSAMLSAESKSQATSEIKGLRGLGFTKDANRLELEAMKKGGFSGKAMDAQKRMQASRAYRDNDPDGQDRKRNQDEYRSSLLEKGGANAAPAFDKKQAYLDKRSAGWSKEESQKFADEAAERAKSPSGPVSSTVRGQSRTNSWMKEATVDGHRAGQRPDTSSGLSPEKQARLDELTKKQQEEKRYSVTGPDRGKRLSKDREDDRKTEEEHSEMRMDAWKKHFDELPGKLQNVTGSEQASMGGSFSSGSEQGMSSALLKQAVDLLTKMVDVSGEHSKNIVDAVMDSGISIG